jgi:hypothetical protein
LAEVLAVSRRNNNVAIRDAIFDLKLREDLERVELELQEAKVEAIDVHAAAEGLLRLRRMTGRESPVESTL